MAGSCLKDSRTAQAARSGDQRTNRGKKDRRFKFFTRRTMMEKKELATSSWPGKIHRRWETKRWRPSLGSRFTCHRCCERHSVWSWTQRVWRNWLTSAANWSVVSHSCATWPRPGGVMSRNTLLGETPFPPASDRATQTKSASTPDPLRGHDGTEPPGSGNNRAMDSSLFRAPHAWITRRAFCRHWMSTWIILSGSFFTAVLPFISDSTMHQPMPPHPRLLDGQQLMDNSKSVTKEQHRDGFLRLVRLYEAWPKTDQAAQWKQRLASFDAQPRLHTPVSPRPEQTIDSSR